MANQFLIVSTGRCGSTMMSDLMNLHPDVLSLSEFFTMVGPGLLRVGDMDGEALWEKMCFVSQQSKDIMRLAKVPEILADVSRGEPYPEPLELIPIPHLANRYGWPDIRDLFQTAVKAQPHASVQQHFANIFDYMRDTLHWQCWVERSGATLDYLNLLLPCFPDAKIIHVYRDGRETAVSMSRHPYFKLRVVYALVGPMPVSEALDYDLSVTDYGRYWSRMMEKGMKALATEKLRTLHVSYERLLSDPRAELDRVFSFMEVPISDRYLDEACSLMRPMRPRGGGLDPYGYRDLIAACAPGTEALHRLVTRGS